MNIDFLSEAIISLGGTNFSVRDIDTIKYHDGNPNNITKKQIQAKYDELVEADKKIQYQRDRAVAYPSIEDQLDMLYHQGIEGWKAEIKKVKDAHPKPE